MALTDPVPSQATDVFRRNMGDSDSWMNQTSGTVTNRTGKTMRPLPVISDAIEQQITDLTADINAAKADLYPIVKFRFLVDTYEITNRNELGDTATGETYRYVGATLPFNVTPATNPVGNPDFEQVIQTDHNNLTNRNAVGAHDASAINFSQYTNQRAKLKAYTAGEDSFAGAALRDAFVTARTLNGLTDCHAFADRTIIDNATDSGTYGTFDATTEIAGTHNQSHQYSFQDRAEFSGGGTISSWGGAIFEPKLTGSGFVTERFAIEIRNIDTLGRLDAIGNLYGVKIDNQTKGQINNFAFWTDQDAGYSFYSSGDGVMQHNGKATFGADVVCQGRGIFGASVPLAGVPLAFVGTVGAQKGFVSSTSTSAQFGVSGNYKLQFISNAAERIIIEDSVENYALRPASSTQNLGIETRYFNIAKVKQVKFSPITSASADNLTIFVDSADGKLTFKDNSGAVSKIAFEQ